MGKENVRVVIRFRPSLSVKEGNTSAVNLSHDGKGVQVLGGDGMTRRYEFPVVLGPEAIQADVYDSAVAPMLDRILQGYNAAFLCYGSTGSGKVRSRQGASSAPTPTHAADGPDVHSVRPGALSAWF